MGKNKLSKNQISELGLYDFQAYIGAMNQSTFGGQKGTQRLIEMLKIPETSEIKKINILEVACSTGYNTIKIAQQYDCHIKGIDLSEVAITKALEKKDKLHLTNVDF